VVNSGARAVENRNGVDSPRCSRVKGDANACCGSRESGDVAHFVADRLLVEQQHFSTGLNQERPLRSLQEVHTRNGDLR
jgi:hypothetical protein